MTNDEAIEQEIQDKGLTSPRISLSHVQEMLDRVEYQWEQPMGTTLTLCHAFLDGTFYLGSGSSACISPENFDAELGRKASHTKAHTVASDKLYELEGYRLWSEVNQ